MTAALREIIEALALALVAFILIQASIQNFRVEGSSMSPTLEGQQYLLVNKLIYTQVDLARLARILPVWSVDPDLPAQLLRPPRPREVIVFHAPEDPERDFVKRVIGAPGDEVEIVDGQVLVNGAVFPESYRQAEVDDTDNVEPFYLEEGEYFVLGDNRRYSNDSRDWGVVPEENIVGQVLLVYWPLADFGMPR